MDLLNAQIATALATFHRTAAGPAIYRRETSELEIAVTWGRSDYVSLSQHGIETAANHRDAIVADFAELWETFGEPRSGDLIIEDGREHTVLPDGNDNCYGWSGHARQALRIHTKVTNEA